MYLRSHLLLRVFRQGSFIIDCKTIPHSGQIDDLLTLRVECSSTYSKQTEMTSTSAGALLSHAVSN